MQFGLPFDDAPARVGPIAPTIEAPLAPASVSAIAPASVSSIAPTGEAAFAPTPVSPIEPPSDAIYFVRHRRARRYLLRVDPDGRVRVTIPRGGSKREAAEFAGRQREWIARQRARLPTAIPPEERRVHRDRARAELPPRLLQLAARHGLDVRRISIRSQRTRWGSCGPDGHICLNWRLVLMPDWVRDYVLIHELMHLRRMDHSPEYWQLVAAADPGYQHARRWLRQHGPSLR